MANTYISSGEVFSDTVSGNGNSVFILDGGSALGASVISWGVMAVNNGGVATSVAASEKGRLFVSQGGIAEDIVLDSNGDARVLNAGAISKIEVNPFASMYISSGGTAEGIVENGGYVEVSSGGTAKFTPNVFSNLVMDADYYQRTTVHSGTTALSTTLNNYSAGLFVYDGGLASDTVISSGGMVIYEGGSAGGVSVQSGGLTLSGGKATNVAIGSEGGISVQSSGLAESATLSNGEMYLFKGGTATDTVVASSGFMYISRTGSAVRTEIQSGGHVALLTEGAMTDVTVRKGGVLNTRSETSLPGVIDGLVLDQGGSAIISKGFNVTNVKENGGAIDVVNGVEATYVSNTFTGLELAANERATVHSGTTAVSTTLGISATLAIYNGGSAVGTVLSEYRAIINVYEGGLADGVAAGNYAYVSVSGGTAKNVSLENSAGGFIYAGGAVSGLLLTNAYGSCYGEISGLVMSGGSMDVVSSGGKLTDALVSGGYLRIESSASATGVTVNTGNFTVAYASLNGATVLSGGSMHVAGLGATASNVVVSGGQLTVISATVDKLEVMDDINPETWAGSIGKVFVSSGTLDHTSVTGYGSVTLSSGAIANNTVLNRTDELRSTYGGEFYVYNGAVANNTVIGENYNMRVWAGGSASGVTVLSGGWADLGSNGGALVTGVEVSSGGWGRVSAGTTVTDLVVHKGAAVTLYVTPGTDVQGTCDGSAFHLQNGVLSDFTVLDGSIAPFISSGGTLMNVTTVRDGGTFGVESGGTVLGTITVEKGGRAYCYGGTVEKLIENGGYVEAHPYYGTDITFGSNTFSGVHLTSGQSATVHSGTTAVGTILQGIYSSGAGASLQIYEGGIASDTEAFDCGYIEVSSGGTAVNTLLHDSGRLMIGNGGTAIGATLKDGGYIYASNYSSGQVVVSDTHISAGGSLYLQPYTGSVSAYGTVVESGGTLYISPAGSGYPYVILSGTTIKSGAVIERVSSSYYSTIGVVSAFDTVLESGVSLTPTMYDYYTRTTLKENAVLEIGSDVYATGINATESGATVWVLSGGEVYSALIGSGASMLVDARGGAYETVVDGGTVRVTGSATDIESINTYLYETSVTNGTVSVDGAMLCYASAGADGRIELSSNSFAYGTFTLTDGGEMHVEEGGEIFFLINDLEAPSTELLVNDLSRVTGAPKYSLVVSKNYQERGTYVFASGAADFDGTFSVISEELVEYGTLKVGEMLKIGDNNYTLHLAGDDLCLTVAKPEGLEVSRGDIDSNNISDVMFQYTGGVGQIGFWMNGSNQWRSTMSLHPVDSWKVLGAYDMNANGNADTVLVGDVEVAGIKGFFVGYYVDAVDTDDNWVNINFLNNPGGVKWDNKIGNLTGNAGKNSIVWHSAEQRALGVWTDGTDNWVGLGIYDENWTLIGCGDFDGDGKDSVVMSFSGGSAYYSVDLDSSTKSMGSLDWSGWEIRAIGDFAGDRVDDIVLFHKEAGLVALAADGNLDSFTLLGMLDAEDWFIVGAGDYNGDQQDDLLVRQLSTGMLGYYREGDMSQWVNLGGGVDMNWTVIA